MIWDNVEWDDTTKLENFKTTTGLILDYKLALENFEDFNNIKLKDFKELETKWYARKNSKLTCNELVALSNNILDGFKAIVNEIGTEKFIIYKDEGIEYRC